MNEELGSGPLNDYELERARRIAENRKRLEQLATHCHGFEAFKAAAQASTPARRKPKFRAVVPQQVVVTRTSARVQALGKVSYKEDFPSLLPTTSRFSVSQPPATRVPQAFNGAEEDSPASKRTHIQDYDLVWSPPEASEKARQAAQALVDSLNNPAEVKAMTPSQVSNGYWCQLPCRFSRSFANQAKRVLQFYGDGDVWEVVFLPRPGGSAGLSGGWRTYAIDNMVMPDDSCVFEKLSEDAMHCYLFRARDYISGATPPRRPRMPASPATAPVTPHNQSMPQQMDVKNVEGVRDVKDAIGSQHEAVTPSSLTQARPPIANNSQQSNKPGQGHEHSPDRCESYTVAAMGTCNVASPAAAGIPASDITPVAQQRHDNKRKLCELNSSAEQVLQIDGTAANPAACLQGSPGGTQPSSGVSSETGAFIQSCGEQAGESMEQEQLFYVQKIRAWKHLNGQFYFLIRWVGYGAEYDTWEPMDFLDEDPLSYKWQGKVPSVLRRKLVAARAAR